MQWRLTMLAVLLVASAFFWTTAIVHPEGGLEYYLVIKPEAGPLLWVGGGEEGTWARHNPGKPLPWWIAGRDFMVLARDSLEDANRLDALYTSAFLLTQAGWAMLSLSLLWLGLRALAKRWPAPRLPHRASPFEFGDS